MNIRKRIEIVFMNMLHSSNATWDFTRYFIALVCIVVVLSGAYLYVMFGVDFDNSVWAARGAFGDAFGVLNSLFGSLAFVGVALTLYLQHRQIIEEKRISALSNTPFLVPKTIKLSWRVEKVDTGDLPVLISCLEVDNVTDSTALDTVVYLRSKFSSGYLALNHTLRAFVARGHSLKTREEFPCEWNHVIEFLSHLKTHDGALIDYTSSYRSFLDVYCSVSSAFRIKIPDDQLSRNRLANLLDPKNGLPAHSGGSLPQRIASGLVGLEMIAEVSDAYTPVRLINKDAHTRMAQYACRSYKAP